MDDFTAEAGISKFFEIARERYSILLKRRAGLPKPWTKDPVFQSHRFCNVFREDDRTTVWFRENIRDSLNNAYAINPATVLLSIVAFRWFNRIETWDKIIAVSESIEDIFADWDSGDITGRIIDHCEAPYVTGAYIIKTPDGKNKVDGVLWCIDEFKKMIDAKKFDKILNGQASMEETCALLKQAPYLGNFMAWQICSDARQCFFMKGAKDRDTWAQPGPGSARGLGRVFYNDVNRYNYGSKSDEREMLARMQQLSEYSKSDKYWNQNWPPLAVIDISHQLCEVDKYIRCIEGGRMKRKYNARG